MWAQVFHTKDGLAAAETSVRKEITVIAKADSTGMVTTVVDSAGIITTTIDSSKDAIKTLPKLPK